METRTQSVSDHKSRDGVPFLSPMVAKRNTHTKSSRVIGPSEHQDACDEEVDWLTSRLLAFQHESWTHLLTDFSRNKRTRIGRDGR